MSGYVAAALRRRVRERFANCCAYCRTAECLSVTVFEVEHITPRSAGGKTIYENLCLACPMCNRHKAGRMVVLDPETQEEVFLFHPHHDLWTEHFAWNDDTTEITPLTPTGRATVAALRMNRHEMIRVRRMWVKIGEHPPQTR